MVKRKAYMEICLTQLHQPQHTSICMQSARLKRRCVGGSGESGTVSRLNVILFAFMASRRGICTVLHSNVVPLLPAYLDPIQFPTFYRVENAQ